MKYISLKIKLILIAIVVLMSSFTVYKTLDNREKNTVILDIMMMGLKQAHYKKHKLDNTFSENVFKMYLQKIDYNKRFLLQEDVDLFERYKYKIDDEIQSESFDLFYLSKEIYLKRIKEVEKYYKSALKKPFDFTKDEGYEFDAEKRKYAKSKKELKENWRLYIKYQVMVKLENKLKIQEKAKADKDTSVKIITYKELEKNARKEVQKNYDDWFHRISKTDEKDMLNMYLNAITAYYGPHTQYFPPKDKENFDIHMSGKLEGIGAQLSQPNAYIKISKIIAGSPCWKQGELEAGDLILKVAQGDKTPVDVVDMRLDEAIKMIRGKKGTEVRLTVKKTDGSIKVIPIIRDVVVLEETFAKSTIVQDSISGKKIGYIYLPQFYADFQSSKGRRCSIDMKKEILKLDKEGVEGMIIDLRNNGGGSLMDAVDIIGFFIDKGATVQVRASTGMPRAYNDKAKGTLYDGALTIMVNEYSASASEIMAAAIQDYGRGIIVGSKQTFGKGTVQRFIGFDDVVRGHKDIKPLGALKLTIQKFYRINGGSTQLKGVSSDIVIPDALSELETGEKDLDYPDQWDEIPKAEYTKTNSISNFNFVKENSLKRTSQDTSFQIIDDYAKYLKEAKDDTYSTLNIEKYRADLKQKSKRSKQIKDAIKRRSSLKFKVLKADSVKIFSDSVKTIRFNAWKKQLENDIYIEEVYKIVSDIKSN